MGRDRNVTISVTDSSQVGGDDSCMNKRGLYRCICSLALISTLSLQPIKALDTIGWGSNANYSYDPTTSLPLAWINGFAPLWWPHPSFPGGVGWVLNSPTNAPNLGVNIMEPIAATRVFSAGTLLLNSNGELWACGKDDPQYAEFGLSRSLTYPVANWNLYGDGTIFQVRHSSGQVVRSVIGFGHPASVAGTHQAALRSDGTALIWGHYDKKNPNAILLGAGAGPISPVVPIKQSNSSSVDLTGIKQVAVGGYGRTFLLMGDGRVLSFGYGQAQPHWIGRTGDWRDPLPVDFSINGAVTPPPMKQVASGETFAAALDVSGRVWSWGDNAFGILGQGTTGGTAMPNLVQTTLGPLDGVKKILCAVESTYALRSDGTVWAWGHNVYDMLGSQPSGGTSPNSPYAAPIPGITGAVDFWAHPYGLYVLGADGVVRGIGQNNASVAPNFHAFGGPGNQYSYPNPYPLFSAWSPVLGPPKYQVKVQPHNSSVIGGTGGVVIRSTGVPHQLGGFIGAAEFYLRPQPQSPVGQFEPQDFPFQNIPASRFRKFVTGTVFYGFDPAPAHRGTDDTNFTQDNTSYTIAIDAQGNLWSAGWEHAPDQALGNGPVIYEFSPGSSQQGPQPFTQITTGTTFIDVDTFAGKTVALASDGQLWSFGENFWAQQAAFAGTDAPVLMTLAGIPTVHEKVIKARQGWNHTIALTDAGHVYAIGDWDEGCNGISTVGQKSVVWKRIDRPGNVPLEGVIDIATATKTCLALTGDGKLYGWGDNSMGAVGATQPMTFPSNQHRAKPLTAPLLSGVKSIAMAGLSWWPAKTLYPREYHLDATSFALRTDGRVITWGSNRNGAAGQNNSNVLKLNAGYLRGGNNGGIQDDIKAISGGGGYGFALTANGRILAWGANAGSTSGLYNQSPSAMAVLRSAAIPTRFYELGSGGSGLHGMAIAANN